MEKVFLQNGLENAQQKKREAVDALSRTGRLTLQTGRGLLLWQTQFCLLIHLSTPAIAILDVRNAQVLVNSGRWIDP